MENLRFLNICLSAFFWQIDNDTITVNRIKKGSNKNGRQEKIEKGKEKSSYYCACGSGRCSCDHWKFSKENDKPGSNSSQYSRGGAGTEERFI